MAETSNISQVFLTFLRLGLTSFGGPIAHLGYFRDEFVTRKRWLSADEYADLVSLCQFLPGPASSQIGIAVGLQRAGLRGALAAWCGFTLPSAIALAAFALGAAQFVPVGILHGLMLVAVAVVAQALLVMGRTACRGIAEVLLAVAALVASLLWPYAWVQIVVLVVATLAGIALFRQSPADGAAAARAATVVSRRTGRICLVSFAVLLGGLPLAASVGGSFVVAVADTFYRAGSLVFGGGHVVLPLLEAQVVGPGWVSGPEFVAGYGAAQAVPGPLFTFSAYLGALLGGSTASSLGYSALALAAIFLPSFLLVCAVMPYWADLRRNATARAALRGVNAAVVGILAAALWRPVITSAIGTWGDVLVAVVAFAALVFAKLPPWVVVVGTALVGLAMSAI